MTAGIAAAAPSEMVSQPCHHFLAQLPVIICKVATGNSQIMCFYDFKVFGSEPLIIDHFLPFSLCCEESWTCSLLLFIQSFHPSKCALHLTTKCPLRNSRPAILPVPHCFLCEHSFFPLSNYLTEFLFNEIPPKNVTSEANSTLAPSETLKQQSSNLVTGYLRQYVFIIINAA